MFPAEMVDLKNILHISLANSTSTNKFKLTFGDGMPMQSGSFFLCVKVYGLYS